MIIIIIIIIIIVPGICLLTVYICFSIWLCMYLYFRGYVCISFRIAVYVPIHSNYHLYSPCSPAIPTFLTTRTYKSSNRLWMLLYKQMTPVQLRLCWKKWKRCFQSTSQKRKEDIFVRRIKSSKTRYEVSMATLIKVVYRKLKWRRAVRCWRVWPPSSSP